MAMRGASATAAMHERIWLPEVSRQREQQILRTVGNHDTAWFEDRIEMLVRRNKEIYEEECVNLNPATNVMNPKAEAVMAAGLGTRASLGHPGDKYEMGLEAIEEIEVLAASLACRVFGASFAEVRVGSGALANAYAFLATCSPGDIIIVPPAAIGGHATHHQQGVAGLLGLTIHEAPIDPVNYTVDVAGLAALANRVQPKLITIGGSLNLVPHPVKDIRAIADEVGAYLLFDAAHISGLIAGRAWPNPLDEGADVMTMSTYKSLGGPPSGLVLTNDAVLAQQIDSIAYPGLTANFDAAKTTALAIGLLDWIDYGESYAKSMVSTAVALADTLAENGIPLFGTPAGFTTSHQFAVDATRFGGGHAAALRLRQANLLTCAIGLPDRSEMAGLRIGTPEIVRWGMQVADMNELAILITRALRGAPRDVAADTTTFRHRFRHLQFLRQ